MTAIDGARDSRASHWVRCDGCSGLLYAKRFARMLKVCPECAQHGRLTAPERLEQWLRTAFTIKQKKVCDDPEMFATYLALAQDAREVVEAYKDKQVDLIAKILSDGVAQGVFEIDNVKATARAVFDATVRYHHPAHAEEWAKPECPSRIDALLALLLKGLRVCKP